MAALERRLSLSLIAGAWLVAGCGAGPVAPTTPRIDALIVAVTAQGGQVAGVLSDSAPPQASAGPLARVAASATVSHAHGGRAHINVAGAGDFTRVYISSPAASGRWELSLSSRVAVEDLELSVNSALRSGRLTIRYTLEGPSGVGGATEQILEVDS